MIKIQTVCWIIRDDKILLGAKKRGLKAGCWNGFGGKLEEGETPLECIKRETREEAGIELADVQEIGIGKFHNDDLPYTIQVHFYKSSQFTGKLISTEEMEPRWFPIAEIPYDNMWPSDRKIIPFVIRDQRFDCEFRFVLDGEISKFEFKQ